MIRFGPDELRTYGPPRWCTDYGLHQVECTVARHWFGVLGGCNEERELWLTGSTGTAGFIAASWRVGTSHCRVAFTLTEAITRGSPRR